MWRGLGGVAVAASGLMMAALLGCAGNDIGERPDARPDQEVRHQVESEFGPLSEDQIAGFEREIVAQYEQLWITYEEFDRVRQAPRQEVSDDHQEHRLHRKLKRRHRTLARLHEDRMWLQVGRGGASGEDRRLAESHRAASQWHASRFSDDGMGVIDQDSELEQLRQRIRETSPDGATVERDGEERSRH